jgi:1-acyl-sn-glycerol-3-phosphate acyltransferase
MPLTERLFHALFLPWMRARLAVHVAGPPRELPADVPLLYCANHQSWWDGFLVRYLHRMLRGRAPFRAVMLQRELGRRPFLQRLGAIGVEPGSLASGRRLLRALSDAPREVGVAFFPQGRIAPDATPPLGFRPGVCSVARAMAPAAIVPVAIRILPGREAKMDAFLSVGSPLVATRGDVPSVGEIEKAVSEELEAIRIFVRQFEENAGDLWPDAAGTLPRSPDRPRLISTDPVPTIPFSRN